MLTHYDVTGREFSLEAPTVSDLSQVDWPSTVYDVYFTASDETRRAPFYMRLGSGTGTINIEGTDAIWVRGTAQALEAFVRRYRSSNGGVSSPWIVVPSSLGCLALTTLTLALAAAACGASFGHGGSGRVIVGIGFILLASLTYFVAIIVPGYLFPRIEVVVRGELPLHVRLRVWAGRTAGGLILSIAAGLIVSTITLAF